jgi:hypothetical protein
LEKLFDASAERVSRCRDEDGNPAPNGVHHLGEALDGGAPALLRASSVIRDDDAVDAVAQAELRVLSCLDAL